ncbi:PREDICTED: uncharacterized protein LOC104826786 [Tarenaya hassleriana]|uniref:uncharacterized protein LOC104826786 n=1 Tax=Tarenaya hassleriana TaxID=28532 RepID=UPI00053C13DF|nr:PREDICTED: uncharacterized protein LOC104826786 [Tarenaya hassleriana]
MEIKCCFRDEGSNSMAKQKPKQLAARPPSKTASRSSGLGISKLNFEADLCGEDSWVMVRKQRVIIWLPSLSVPENRILQKPASTQSKAELGNITDTPQMSTINMVVETQQQSHPETCHDVSSADKSEKLNGLDPTSSSQPINGAPSHPQQEHRTQSASPHRVGTLNLHKIHRLSARGFKPVTWPRAMCLSSLHEGNDNALLKQRLRAKTLERKIEKVGGLDEWLASIGLGEKLERIFRGKRLTKFQVANLTMEKLKQMGASAVGPRRKLIHAIRCVYHPYCLNPSWKCYT